MTQTLRPVLFLSPNSADGFGGSGVQMAHLCRHLQLQGIPSQLVLRKTDSATYVHLRRHISLATNFPDISIQTLSLESGDEELKALLAQTNPSIAYVHLDLYKKLLHIFESLSMEVILYAGRSANAELWDLQGYIGNGHIRGIVSISTAQAGSFREQLANYKLASQVVVAVIRQGTYCSKSKDEADYITTLIPEFCQVVVNIGSTRPYKQIDHFIRLVDAIHLADKNMIGVYVGPITKQWFDSLATDYSIKVDPISKVIRINNVLFVGPSFHVGNWLERASLCVCTSMEYEGIPGFLRESMLFECPVVSYEVGAVAELVRSGWNGKTVALGNELELLRECVKLLSRDATTAELTGRAKRFVRMFFSARSHKTRTQALLAILGIPQRRTKE